MIVHVVGARPNYIKAAPVWRALAERGIEQCLVDTGQHYDVEMRDVFFRDLELPEPALRLEVGSGTRAEQVSRVLSRLAPWLDALRPQCVVVYGDVNSTLGAALAADSVGVPIAHVEAGLRSGDWTMPEERNRVVVDRIAQVHFVTEGAGLVNLGREGIHGGHLVGNPMIDSLVRTERRPSNRRPRGKYFVATLHRPSNVDTPRLHRLLDALRDVHAHSLAPVVLVGHPRARDRIVYATGGWFSPTPPLPYPEMVGLVEGSIGVITDSGGLQEETTALGIPCWTLRTSTERPCTLKGTNTLVPNPEDLLDAIAKGPPANPQVPPRWDGHAGERIADVLIAHVPALEMECAS